MVLSPGTLPQLVAILWFAALPFAQASDSDPLPGTASLTMAGDLSEQMHEAAEREMDRHIVAAQGLRGQFWKRDVASPEAYESSIQENRGRLRKIIGLVDERVPVVMERFGTEDQPALAAETDRYTIHQVRWSVLEGVTGEGLLLTPKSASRGYVVALPDADQTPEQLTGLTPGVAAESQFARRLVENGFVVVVPVLIDRSTTGSGYAHIAMTNQPHRE